MKVERERELSLMSVRASQDTSDCLVFLGFFLRVRDHLNLTLPISGEPTTEVDRERTKRQVWLAVASLESSSSSSC